MMFSFVCLLHPEPVVAKHTQLYLSLIHIFADYAELDRNLTVHMSRHTFATMCLNNGVKMENVSKMLGHTNVRTTQQYAKVLNAEEMCIRDRGRGW